VVNLCFYVYLVEKASKMTMTLAGLLSIYYNYLIEIMFKWRSKKTQGNIFIKIINSINYLFIET